MQILCSVGYLLPFIVWLVSIAPDRQLKMVGSRNLNHINQPFSKSWEGLNLNVSKRIPRFSRSKAGQLSDQNSAEEKQVLSEHLRNFIAHQNAVLLNPTNLREHFLLHGMGHRFTRAFNQSIEWRCVWTRKIRIPNAAVWPGWLRSDNFGLSERKFVLLWIKQL